MHMVIYLFIVGQYKEKWKIKKIPTFILQKAKQRNLDLQICTVNASEDLSTFFVKCEKTNEERKITQESSKTDIRRINQRTAGEQLKKIW